MIKEHSLLMRADMVLATLKGDKTQTRRPITFDNSVSDIGITRKDWKYLRWGEAVLESIGSCLPVEQQAPSWRVPFKNMIDRIEPRISSHHSVWIREKMHIDVCLDLYYSADKYPVDDNQDWQYRDAEYVGGIPSIHMPRWASRINLDVNDVRSERIQEITAYDCFCEGLRVQQVDGAGPFDVAPGEAPSAYINIFRKLWDSINLKRGFGWQGNHPVWIYDYARKVKK